MTSFLSEGDIEEFAIQLFRRKGYEYVNGALLAPNAEGSERSSTRDVVLTSRLESAIRRLNVGISEASLSEVLRKVTATGTHDLTLNNKAFHAFLVEGVPYDYPDLEGTVRYDRARIIDFENAAQNDWLVVNQLTVREGEIERRPDLLVFINGLPLGLIEFKSPTDSRATIRSAFRQLQTYKADLVTLLGYNELLVASDGTHAQIGTLTADWERFSVWKSADGSIATTELEFLIDDLFEKERLLEYLRFFTLFEVVGPTISKKIASYHQFHAVTKAVESARRATAAGGDRRIGVYWHTQGSGKTLSMTFFAGKVAQDPILANPTLILLTDRNDLDGQLFDQFSACSEYLRQVPEQVDNRSDLRERLTVAAGHIIFTTIQKFFPEEGEARYPQLTDRRNVIVVADEAHRTQYGLNPEINAKTGGSRVGFARHLRDAVPNASFIGFTGTPVERADHNTRAVFGDYIDIYDVRRAVDDGATVPIYYEARVAKLKLREEELPKIDQLFEEITEGQEEDEKRRSASRWSQIEALVGAEHRIHEVAADIVDHLERRRAAFDFGGKAMVVCMSRRVCTALYEAISEIRPEWHSPDDEAGSMKVVITGSAADDLALKMHIRPKLRRKVIEKRFKDDTDGLMLVIVRDMWLTGFDVPALHTMYVDKPMKGHSLMQAIARVNRVFRDKPGGLIADYIGIGQELRRALITYADSGGTGDPVLSEDDAVAMLRQEYEIVRDLFHGFPYQQYIEGTTQARLLGLNSAADFILGLDDGKTRYLAATQRLTAAIALASTSEYARVVADECAFFRAVRATIVKATISEGQSLEDVELALRQLVSTSLTTQGVIDVLAQSGMQRPDVSIFSDEFLVDLRGLRQKNLAREMLEKLLRNELRVRASNNAVSARRFSERLAAAVRRYEVRSLDTVELLENLIEIARELKADLARGAALGLSNEEVAFYDALSLNDSAAELLGDEYLRMIARDLLKGIRESLTTDWSQRESAKAAIRVRVRRILRRHGYPPDKTESATQQVLEQAELVCQSVA